MARPGISAPYYLAGEQRRRWHTNQAETAALGAGGAALAARYLVKNPGVTLHRTLSPHDSKAAMKYAAIGIGSYGAYHAGRSIYLNQKKKGKR